jgi:HAD superfamily hydrolase (TIGR01509 family)
MLAGVSLRALLFDFDGLILDTETPELVSWQELWAEHGQRFPLERHLAELGTVGGDRGALAALEQLAGPLDRDAAHERRSARKLALIELEELRPGVLELLTQARARGIAIAVVSSSSRGWVVEHLARLACSELFDLIVTGDHDRERGKPRPTLYLEALASLGVAPGEAIAFEDSPNGVRAAVAAGVFCVAVPNGVTAALSLAEADLVVDSLAELPLVLLERLVGQP